jgi:hypothetical protein
MSQKSRPPRKWLHRAVAAVIVLASYYTVHCATCDYGWGAEWDDFGNYTLHVTRRQHQLSNGPMPSWAESLLRPASRFDNLIGLEPCQPPGCILIRPKFVAKATNASGQALWVGHQDGDHRPLVDRLHAEVFKSHAEAHVAIGMIPVADKRAGYVVSIERVE